MKRTSIILVVALVGLGVVLATALTEVGGTSLFHQSDGDSFAQPTAATDEALMPNLSMQTTEQQEQAIDIVLTDNRVKQLLGGLLYTVEEPIAWTGGGGRHVGMVVPLSLDEPSLIRGPWTSLSWSCEEDPLPPPVHVPYNATYGDVTSIQVFVNLNTGEVDQILPFGDGGLKLVGEREFTSSETSITMCDHD